MKNGAPKKVQVNVGYPLFQIAKALTTSEEHNDPEIRARASQKIRRWLQVLGGILEGTLEVGSRTPVQDVPKWATLEVVTGGFATGGLLASGPLLEHEQAWLTQLPAVPQADARQALNGYSISEEGLSALQEMIRTGRYAVTLPEEGALLVVAWLAQNGYDEDARNILAEIGPYFSKLRFYPVPLEHPARSGSQVFVQTVGNTIKDLKKIKPNLQILAQKEAVQIWTPLYDQMIGLFLETVMGEPPSLKLGLDGKPIPNQRMGKFPIEGGWPCQIYPEDWSSRAEALLSQYHNQKTEHTLCKKRHRPKDNFSQIRNYLERCAQNPKSLSGREIGRIRLILASYLTKRGRPDSEHCQSLRQRQIEHATAPTFQEISKVVISRLETYPKDDGLDDLTIVAQPITLAEAEQWKVAPNTIVPETLQRKAQRCLRETAEELVLRGIITSGEALAQVLPQVTSGIQAADIADPTLSQIYTEIYRAFRRRRSLLLLNLQSQIKLEELPWVAAIERFRKEYISSRAAAKRALKEISILVINAFPYAILPNKLCQELRALSKSAHLDLPIVDELAADIFVGEFSDKFLGAAKVAADLLEGTLYQTYYGIDYEQVKQLSPVERPKQAGVWHPSNDPFAKLCVSRAGVTSGRWDPAINGMIIEQQQILTSQNLAVLFVGLDLADVLRDRLESMAQRNFRWICQRQQVKAVKHHARLIMLKNTAYAWRQMIFYLALLPKGRIEAFILWAEAQLKKEPEDFQSRFHPVLHGLALAAEGHSLDDSTVKQRGVRRFLGWSKDKHWLLN